MGIELGFKAHQLGFFAGGQVAKRIDLTAFVVLKIMEAKINDVPDAEDDCEINDRFKNKHQAEFGGVEAENLPEQPGHHKKEYGLEYAEKNDGRNLCGQGTLQKFGTNQEVAVKVRDADTHRKGKKVHEVFLVGGTVTQSKKDGVHYYKKGPAGELAIPVYFGFSAQGVLLLSKIHIAQTFWLYFSGGRMTFGQGIFPFSPEIPGQLFTLAGCRRVALCFKSFMIMIAKIN